MRIVTKIVMLGLFSLSLNLNSYAQSRADGNVDEGQFLYSVVQDHDTMLLAVLPTVKVVADAPRRLRRKARKYNRLRNAVYVTYPYARIVAGVLTDVNDHLEDIHGKEAKKKYLDLKEKELKTSFGPKIEDLSIYQGRVLIKLIYRETGNDCYYLIKQLKGGFSARFWQTIAFVFGSNLKTPYDKTENTDIESFVQEIENVPFYYNAYRYRTHFN